MTPSHLLRLGCAALLAITLAIPGLAQQAPAGSEPEKGGELFIQGPRPDVRVIIDISGSMKQNDPKNLRRPALELLVELFPEDARAGVWTFGQWVNNLVPSEPVTDSWRNNARSQAKKINSVALHTNIPAVLERALEDAPLDPGYETHFILLTDGMVDVSKDPAENAAARQRVLDEILPQLRDAGVRIHTVALSNNADSELMERLALETGGLAAVAHSAEELTDIFLQAFDAAAPREEVPLEGNRFYVDSSIEEFTALVFRKEESDATVLVSPDGETYSREQHGEDVRWFSQQNYDLITVTQPYEGEWVVQADLQPSSRVTIVSNLSLQVNRLPKGYFLGNDLELSAALSEQGEVIARPEFLDLVDVSYEVVRRGEDGNTWLKNLSDLDPRPEDGVFRDMLSVIDQPGVYDVTVRATAKTFQRQQKQTLQARENFIVDSTPSHEVPARHAITVTTKNPAIQADTLKITANIDFPAGETQTRTLEQISERRWEVKFTGADQSVRYQVQLNIVGLYRDGSPLRVTESLEIEHRVPGTPFMEAAPEVEPEPEPQAQPEPEPEPAPEPEPEPESEGINWKQIGLYAGLVVGNLLVLLLGYLAYRAISGGTGSTGVLESEDELEPEPEPVEESIAEDSPAGDDSPATDAGGPEPDVDDEVAEVDLDGGDDELEVDEGDDDEDDLGLPDDAIDIDPEKP